eukprot:1147322-Pelagomonas_calceolata.AAC.16
MAWPWSTAVWGHAGSRPSGARSLKHSVVMRVFRPCRAAELSGLVLIGAGQAQLAVFDTPCTGNEDM